MSSLQRKAGSQMSQSVKIPKKELQKMKRLLAEIEAKLSLLVKPK